MLEAQGGGWRRALAFSICTWAVVGCAVNPVTGRPEIVLISAERERQIGAEAAEQVAAQMGLVDDERLVALVDAVGQRMAAHSPRRDVTHTFAIVDIDEPNAFALPGGYIYVSRGLLALTNSEQELANVLGHEIAHVAARHAAQRQTRAAGAGLLALGGALLGTALGVPGQVIGAPLQLLGAGLIAGYSREQEREADRIGQELAASAGVDPGAMAEFLRTLERTAQLRSDTMRRPSFFDTHPATPERVESAQERARNLKWVDVSGATASRDEYLRILDGLLVGENPAEGVLRDGHFLHPDLDFGLRFPQSWAAENGRRAVGAVSPRRDARMVLGVQERGDDPRQAAKALLQQLSQQVELEVTGHWEGRIHGLPAFRVRGVTRTRDGVVGLDFTWIAHRELIFRLTGAALGGISRANGAAFEATARSFGPLDRAERDSIREKRLRVTPARRGERLEQLSARSGNAWGLRETAVKNALLEDSPLARGQLLKVAVPQPYRPRRGAQ
jgi:predicted Zn-dependent protease